MSNKLTVRFLIRALFNLVKPTRKRSNLLNGFSIGKKSYLSGREVYKLVTVNNPKIIHGLLCFEDKNDHIFIHLVEGANFNKGTNKIYLGVAGNLFAFACKVYFEKGYEGYVAFDSKSALIEHYKKKLGAKHFKGQRMYIEAVNALKLVKKYFQD